MFCNIKDSVSHKATKSTKESKRIKEKSKISTVVRGASVNSYSFSWFTGSEGLLEKWKVDSNISANIANAIILTMCQPLMSKFMAEAAIPIMPIIFIFRFIILPKIPLSD